MMCAECAWNEEQAKNSIQKKRLLIIAYINRFVLYFAFVKQIDVHLPCIQRRIKKNTIKDNFLFWVFLLYLLACKGDMKLLPCMCLCVCWGGGGWGGPQWTLTKLTHLHKSYVFRFILMNIYSFRTYQPGFSNNVDYRS